MEATFYTGAIFVGVPNIRTPYFCLICINCRYTISTVYPLGHSTTYFDKITNHFTTFQKVTYSEGEKYEKEQNSIFCRRSTYKKLKERIENFPIQNS